MGLGSAVYSFFSTDALLARERERRGRYIAHNLALNSAYGVLTEDKTLLRSQIDNALSASAVEDRERGVDVVGAMVRNARGVVLVEVGRRLRPSDLPAEPAADVEHREAVTTEGEAVELFRAPVTSVSSGRGSVASELGLAGAGGASAPELRGGVEVLVSRRRVEEEQRGILARTVLVALAFVLAGSAAGLVLLDRWLNPVRRMVEVASAVAQGDLTASLAMESEDEIGTLARSLRAMVGNLRGVVDKIQDASVQVASSAGQISTNARLITQGAQSQALAAEETSTSMEEIAASIQTVAGNAESLASHVHQTSSSITEMSTSIEQVARSAGTLAETVGKATTTIEEMAASVDHLARNLESVSHTVRGASETVEDMASFIAAASRNAEELSSAAQKTSLTVSRMTAEVKQVAEIAEEADRIARKASEDARSGDEAVGRTVEGMKRVSESMETSARVIGGLGRRSQEIGKILEVIEEIADQTNLLALNAAIEAARAGEAGRGFAVVADEVRKLAERSVEAAKEIAEVVRQVQQDTTSAVETTRAGAAEAKEGIALTDRSGLALRSILESVSRSSGLMAQIAGATAKQSQASAEALATVSHMSAATHQVTSAVKEQAEGSKQIRQAMESIKRAVHEAAEATREQAAGGQQVRLAVENMNRIAAEVGSATREQAEGSRQIVRAVESMNRMTQQVSLATAEQKRGGELVVRSMSNISEVARDNLATVEEMSHAAQNLAQQAEGLAKLIAVFRVQ
jgi:methyl-accepting chemotaxis protein